MESLGKIRLDIHTEVITGTISDGLPNQTTAEVTTKLLMREGQKIFIGGLLRDTLTQTRSGIPILKDVPFLGFLFSKREQISVTTETVVLVSAYVAGRARQEISDQKLETLPIVEGALEERRAEKARIFQAPPQGPANGGSFED